ncbi:MAG: NAD-dependent epimerase/dehydratase family protein [Leeuwenhoekiella sp.]
MILVTGGTGLVGSHLLWNLIASGEKKVRAIYRTEDSREKTKALFLWKIEQQPALSEKHPFKKIEWVKTDLNNLNGLKPAFEGVTRVYHCAAMISFNPREYQKLKKVNVEGTANIVNLSLAYGVKKLCYVSSIAAIGTGKNPRTETTFWEPHKHNSVYSITKFAAEMEVWRGTQEGLPAVIVNPGLILGEGDYDSGSGKIFGTVYGGNSFYTPGSTAVVDVNDVVEAMIRLSQSEIQNERYILVSKNMDYKEIFSVIAEALASKKPKYALQPWQMYGLAFLDRVAALIFGKDQVIFRTTVRSAFLVRTYSNSKLKKAIDFDFTPIPETVTRVARHFLAQHKEQQT